MHDRYSAGATMLLAAIAASAIACGNAPSFEQAASTLRADDLARLTRTLSGDEFAGRGPAGPGELRTLEFLQSEMARIGLAPGFGQGPQPWLQPVPVLSISANPETAALRFRGGNRATGGEFAYGEQFVAWTSREEPTIDVEAPLIFVGYGVRAPEEQWDDYSIDVSGAVVVMLVNDPPVPGKFGDQAMTYYGRWTYKFEEAARQGAVGALLVHDATTAGYDWPVVRSSWTGPQFALADGPGHLPTTLVQGWLSASAAEELFATAGLDAAEAYLAAAQPGFAPTPLGLTARIRLDSELERVESANVIGRLEGSDPAAAGEAVLWIAHWDHLGVDPSLQGDRIYNGALDNATGLAALLEIAEALASTPGRARRTHLFVATTLEERGLLGATHYAANPVLPLADTVAAINIDGLNVWGPTEDVTVIGLGNSELDELLMAAVALQGRTLSPDPEPEKGFFYRSDHFPLARAGVPALYLDAGTRFRDRAGDYSDRVRDGYAQRHYHRPSDEFDPTWNFAGAVEDLRALLRVGMELADSTRWPQWSEGTEFRGERERSRAPR